VALRKKFPTLNATGIEIDNWPALIDALAMSSTDRDIAARLDRVDAALAKRVGDMIEKNSALKVWLADWLKAYSTDIFPEPDLEKAAAILKANGMTIDSLSASMGRHVLAKVIAQLDGQMT